MGRYQGEMMEFNQTNKNTGNVNNEGCCERCDKLEAQVKLLWAVLSRMPRLEGFRDAANIEAFKHNIDPWLPMNEGK